jgi:hypothetical protein
MGMVCCLWVFDCCLEEIPVIKEDAATLPNPEGAYLKKKEMLIWSKEEKFSSKQDRI